MEFMSKWKLVPDLPTAVTVEVILFNTLSHDKGCSPTVDVHVKVHGFYFHPQMFSLLVC